MASYFAESTLKTKQLATIRECLAVWGLITIYRPRGVRLGALGDFGFVTWIKFTWASPVTLWYSFPPPPPPPPLSLTVNLQSSFYNPSFILRWRQLVPHWKPCDLDNFFYPPLLPQALNHDKSSGMQGYRLVPITHDKPHSDFFFL